MTKKYIVLWMPTLFHKELEPLEGKNNIENEKAIDGYIDLSDKSDSNPYFAKFSISSTKDITIFSKVHTADGIKEFDVLLKLEEDRRNGFMQFSYDEERIPNNCRDSFSYNLTTAIYVKLKSFFMSMSVTPGKTMFFSQRLLTIKLI